MQKILIVITKEKYSSSKTRFALKLAESFQKKGNLTTLFLIEDGVYLAIDSEVDTLIDSGITVKAEKWDLKARGLKNKIKPYIKINNTEDLFVEISDINDKALWF
ncbi:MAG: DsrH/TusB family sulfur metabolism protein [Candidatus Helarchaeota archaeon]